MDRLERKVAVVTGAASGIGLALATRFAQDGMHVVLADIESGALEGAASVVSATGADVLTVVTDVSDPASVEALARATFERFGTAHVVCNNAGVGGAGDPWRGPLSAWEWIVGVNLMGVVHGIHAFLPALEAQGEGHIVNTASMAGVTTGVLGAYSATKHAVVALSEGLFIDQLLRGTGVGVSVLCPGFVRTQIMRSDRNWPAQLGPLPVGDEVGLLTREIGEQLVAEGMAPAQVADSVRDAVRGNRFWIFPHPEMVQSAVERAHGMLDGRDPLPPSFGEG